ncbi:hypothetical protein HMPREF9628_02122 [Peptoanaerobacter stomatis]|uniref:Phage replisome organiser N-terminal domain-containing protein n=1 Tax=Peptoanaerobacter stomatis TaxID=796937 RepID=G9XEQ2_9FIRM|nr:phage replisome organizer N-terminal domain-containing protein [Peptoanaerobacter stomatis]EHL18237.1 hypothetical protein HMPREF9628_02122 [Peptoanaerobacter stomatis]
MSDNKKYYYLKLKEDFFTSETITLLESMKDGVLYSNILLKLYLMSLKNNGKLIFRDNIPYTTEMIATITRHQVGTVERAIKIFLELELIDQLPDNILYMADIELFIGKSSTEGERKRKARLENQEKIRLLEDTCLNNGGQMSATCPPENRDKRLDIRDKRIEGKEETQLSAPILYGEYKNIRLTDEEYQKLKNKLQNHTDTMIEKLSRYLKSKGTDYKDHYVTILNWYEQDKEKLTQKNIQNGSSKTYSTNYEDSDSL